MLRFWVFLLKKKKKNLNILIEAISSYITNWQLLFIIFHSSTLSEVRFIQYYSNFSSIFGSEVLRNTNILGI